MTIALPSETEKALERPPEDQCRDCGQRVTLVRSPDGTRRFAAHDWDGVRCRGWFAAVDDEHSWKYALESRFTAQRQECPHPERWHSSDADSTEWEVSELVAAFVRALQPDLVVETGTAWGQTAEAIGRALVPPPQGAEAAVTGKLYTLEVDSARVESSRARCLDLPVEVVAMSSLDWTPPGPIGFAWFDSLHDLRIPEFRKFFKWFSPGAFVGFHDCGSHQGTLWRQILGLEAEGLLLPVRLPTPRGVCFAEVTFP